MRVTASDITTLFETQSDTLFRHCYLRVLDRDTGRQIMEHAFQRLWNYIQDGRTLKQPEVMLYRIANGLIEEHRRSNRSKKIVFTPSQQEPVETRQLLTILGEVDDTDRDALVYHFVDQFSVKRTASMLGRPVADVSRKIERGSERVEALLRH